MNDAGSTTPGHSPVLPALRHAAAGEARVVCASSNSSRPTSATRTRAAPMPAPPGISRLVRERRRAVDRRRPAAACRRLDRGRHARAGRTERQAAARRDPPPVRLARHRPGRAGQPGRLGARAPARRDARANAGARSGRGARAARQHRHVDHRRSARPRPDRADGLFLRAHRRGARDDGRGCLSRRTAGSGCGCARRAASGTRCRATTTSKYLIAYLDGAGLRGSQGAAVPHDRARHRKLTRTALPQANAYAMIRRRAAAAGIGTARQPHLPRDRASPPI